ncbi:MAG: lipocalin family protein [Crocinitomicaceae bacterium]|nr:lipocalin family protein [Crocinitomicaceae bacterium]
MKNKISSLFILSFLLLWIFPSCVSIPKNVKPVKAFDANKYLGKWYEIARLDMRFERNLNNVTATYSLNQNGTIKVDNRGYDYVDEKWKQSVGKAKFIEGKDLGSLKVSFFGPFYAGYHVVALDDQYQYALVAGSNQKYLWILSRTKEIPENVKLDYLKIAQKMGYNTDALIWVEHNQ